MPADTMARRRAYEQLGFSKSGQCFDLCEWGQDAARIQRLRACQARLRARQALRRCHRARAARIAISRRRSGLSADARAGPPRSPPRRPSCAACTFRVSRAERRLSTPTRSVGARQLAHGVPMTSASPSSSHSPSHSQTRHRRRTRSTVRFMPARYATYTPWATGYRRKGSADGNVSPGARGERPYTRIRMLDRSRDA
jgi:hypothetical protein